MRARVQNGRWVIDEPADLPEGTEVEIVTRPVPVEVHLDERLRTTPTSRHAKRDPRRRQHES
jgi:hypothetical protein